MEWLELTCRSPVVDVTVPYAYIPLNWVLHQLHPNAKPLMLIDGLSFLVLMLQDTLPMTYHITTYHIPIKMYLPPRYTLSAPPII
jgi:ESCRT-I complex subunit TSG101